MDKILKDIEDEYDAKLEAYIQKEFKSVEIPQVWSSDEDYDSDDSTAGTTLTNTTTTGVYSSSVAQSKSSRSSMIPLFQPLSKISFSSGIANEHQEIILTPEDFSKITFNIPSPPPPPPKEPPPKKHDCLLDEILKKAENDGKNVETQQKSQFAADVMTAVAGEVEPDLVKNLLKSAINN